MTEAPLAEIAGTSLVALGSFNPRIFHPEWFVRHGLMAEGVAETAEVEIINNDVAMWGTEELRVQVVSEKLAFSGIALPAEEILRDLMSSTFAILRETPVVRLGINRHAHYRFSTEEEWHAVGHRLAPKDVWREILPDPGTLSLSVVGPRKDGWDGLTSVKVEPSRRVEPGLFVEVNDEYRDLNSKDAEWLIKVLNEEWLNSWSRSRSILDTLASLRGE